MTAAILVKSLRDRRRALIGNSLGLVALVVWLGALFPILRENQGFNDIMERVRRKCWPPSEPTWPRS